MLQTFFAYDPKTDTWTKKLAGRTTMEFSTKAEIQSSKPEINQKVRNERNVLIKVLDGNRFEYS